MPNSKVNLRIAGLSDVYTIHSDGYVFNETKQKRLNGTSITSNNRYVKIHLDKFYPLHRLVAKHFVDNPMPSVYTQVNHIDGDRWNNSASNLEWCSPSQNVSHAYANELKSNKGELNPISILTEQQVARIWSLRNTKLSARQIRDKLGLSVGISSVKQIRNGTSWKHITSKLD